MKKLISNRSLLLGTLALAIITPCLQGFSADSIPSADPETGKVGSTADRVLREMGDYLKTAGQFVFRADITYDSILTDGQHIQHGGVSKVALSRPNQLRVAYAGDERQSKIYFDRETFTFHDASLNLYAVTRIPPKLDDAVDLVFEKYGFSVPIADLIYADPYRVLIENSQSGFRVGRQEVDGASCHHLAFTQETIDWQIWIEDGLRPVPRKLVITYKDEPGSPQYIARLSDWDFEPRIAASAFRFDVPEGASKMEFLPTESLPVSQEGEQP